MPRHARACLTAAALLFAACSSPLPGPGDGPSDAATPLDQAGADRIAGDHARLADGPGGDAASDLSPGDSATADLLLTDGAARDRGLPDLAVALDLGRVDANLDQAPVDAPVDAPIDAPFIHDQGFPDLADDGATMPDRGLADLAGPCRGGYLNSDAGNACPTVCHPSVEPVEEEAPWHVNYCDRVTWNHNPPTSGMHWPWHPEWGIYPTVAQREWWVHALEHGGVVLLYNCPPGGGPPDGGPQPFACDGGSPPPPNSCANEIAQLAQLYTERKPDHLGVVRIIVTPDPYLPKRFGAVAWNWSYVDDQLDLKALRCFIDARYGRGPEDAP